MKKKDDIVENLTIVRSSLPGTGVVKINEDSFVRMGLRNGDRVVVQSARKSLILFAEPDPVYKENTIRLRMDDMASLGVHEGLSVFVKKYYG